MAAAPRADLEAVHGFADVESTDVASAEVRRSIVRVGEALDAAPQDGVVVSLVDLEVVLRAAMSPGYAGLDWADERIVREVARTHRIAL